MNKDVVIIGAGPSGMFASFYCSMRGMSSVVIDPLEMLGGRVSALYPEKYIYDIAGFDKIKAVDLINNLEKQMMRFKDEIDVLLNNEVQEVIKEDEQFKVVTDKTEITAKAVIVAAGSGAFQPRKLNLEGEDATNIHYHVSDMSKFKKKKVAIFGGGDSAVDWSLMLNEVADEVNVIHRRDEFRAHEKSVDELKASSVNIHTPYTAKQLICENNQINKLVISSKEEEKTIEVDEVIVNYGFIAKLGNIEKWGLDIEKNKIKVDSMQKTNIEGIFAIGDICTYPGKADLIATGFGEAPVAVNSAFLKIFPEKSLGVLHSSSVIGE